MATLYAQADGNYTSGAWSAADLWNTAANGSGSDQTPTSADTLISNAFTITIADSLTVVKVTNTGGGTFALSNGVTLTCTDGTAGVVGDASDVGAVTWSLASPNTATLAAKVLGGNGSKEWGVNFSGTGKLTINGSVTGGSFTGAEATAADGVYMSGSGTLVIANGTSTAITGGSGQYARGVNCTAVSGAVITITGNLIGGSANYSNVLQAAGAATITVTGNLTGGSSSLSYAISTTGTAAITITGNLTGGSYANGTAHALNNTGAATITVTGTATGAACNAINNTNASAVITVIGDIVAGNTSAVANTQAGATLKCTGPFLASAAGVQAVYSPSLRWHDSRASYFQIRTADLGAIRSLYTANHADAGSGQAAVSNVRHGTVYGPSSELTGTCYVPAAASVLYGVNVDATTGTATLSAADIRSALGLASANLDTQLATKPSTDVVGGIVAALGV